MNRFFLLFVSILVPALCKASVADLFAYNEQELNLVFFQLNDLENQVMMHPELFESDQSSTTLSALLLNPDSEQKSAGDSFFKGLTLGCFGLFDSYLSQDKDKYKRGPLWTGCCLNSVLIGALYYLLDTNYFHLIPPGS